MGISQEDSWKMASLSIISFFFIAIAFVQGLPPPRFGKEFGSPQLDEVGDASLQVDVSAISKMYRKREEALNTADKTVEDIAKANNKNKDKADDSIITNKPKRDGKRRSNPKNHSQIR